MSSFLTEAIPSQLLFAVLDQQQVQEEQGGGGKGGGGQDGAGGDPYVRAVCFSPDGLSIVAGMEKNSAKILLLEEKGGRQGAVTLSGHEVGAGSVKKCRNSLGGGATDDANLHRVVGVMP